MIGTTPDTIRRLGPPLFAATFNTAAPHHRATMLKAIGELDLADRADIVIEARIAALKGLEDDGPPVPPRTPRYSANGRPGPAHR